ncbi:3-deoxy-D-manno-octulosonic-acid transferase [Rhodoblastus sphagnicola]|nr:3-deoxy-D-manno-octulosonic acid transferase [Rhodoblastus sphagnicola]MBB4196716.1 3-deoxy-D-manno-octulosonic-acid transferase [Rhodoblastus sphagnicola]
MFLPVYRAATQSLAPFSGLFLRRRAQRGKEDLARLDERRGRPGLMRPAGRLAWLHGASVGEGLALLPLVDRLIAKGFHVLVTTGTVTSARILDQRLPSGAFHQYAPLDAPRFIERFLDHWRPDLFLLAESEIWPNMICAVHARAIPIASVNARLSARSFRRWRLAPGFISALLSRIDICLAQSEDDAARLLQLGAPRVHAAGNLKYDVEAPPADPARLRALYAAIGPRPVWIAASTHSGEEALALLAHKHLARQFPNLLTVLAPRHDARGDEITLLARETGLEAAQRSRGEPPNSATQVYVADTMGELGLFYRLSNAIFVGKSLMGRGGQNPIEPAKLGSAILHGPHVGNFVDVYAALDLAGGAFVVNDADELARRLAVLFGDPGALRRAADASRDSVAAMSGASDRVMRAIEPYFAAMIVSGQ